MLKTQTGLSKRDAAVAMVGKKLAELVFFVASIRGTGRNACVRLVGGLVISSHCNTFPEKCTNQMVCHIHQFSPQVLILPVRKCKLCGMWRRVFIRVVPDSTV
jgi:hypothetical protein